MYNQTKKICHAKNRNETVAMEALQKKPPSQIPHPQTHTTAGLAQTLKGDLPLTRLARVHIWTPVPSRQCFSKNKKKWQKLKMWPHGALNGMQRPAAGRVWARQWLLLGFVSMFFFSPAETKQWRRQVKHAGSEGGNSECSTALDYDILERTTVKVPPLKVVPNKWQHKKGRCKKRKIWVFYMFYL